MPRKSSRRKSSRREPMRCSVKKLFAAMDTNNSGTISLAELQSAFKKAAGGDQRLTWAEAKKACYKYAGNAIGAECGGPTDCGANEICNYDTEMCIAIPGVDTDAPPAKMESYIKQE